MNAIEIVKILGAPITAGLILFAANKFYSGAMLLINHDHQIKDLIKASTVDLPNQINTKIDSLKDDIIHAHAQGIELFSSELTPIKDDVKMIKIDIRNLKTHTKYKDYGQG